ncbi:MAG: hypothetical protein AMXMBFR64_21560 [Myxococcales bacterium]
MDRTEMARVALWPLDTALGAAVNGLERAGLLAQASGTAMAVLRGSLRAMLRRQNDLLVEGAEHVPPAGGVIFACNHQSWLDVQVLGAAAPRRVHFVAKSEFKVWPALRHLVRLSESVFVDRGGDDRALAGIADALRRGQAVAIFPEGTIPGEEDIPRTAVDPRTGLLRGHSGVARLAIEAGVPIVPVGVSGTGRAFPPEVYPRLELLRLPASTPVRIRFGEPIRPAWWSGRPAGRPLARELTDHVMERISALVDHRVSYVPMELPLRPVPRHDRIGVLLLHGFTSDVAAVDGLLPHLRAANIDVERPVLRGHGTHHLDLRGVTAAHWVTDAERAMVALANRVDRVVVVGLSMGGLVALELARRHPLTIAGVVTVAAALRFADPLTPMAPLLARLFRTWPSPRAFNDPSLAAHSRNYPRFATDAFASLLAFSREVESRLGEVHVPIRVLQSRRDTVIAPVSANLVYEKVGSAHRELLWYEQSGHEMMQDLEADQVFGDIMDFVLRFPAPRHDARSRRRPAA